MQNHHPHTLHHYTKFSLFNPHAFIIIHSSFNSHAFHPLIHPHAPLNHSITPSHIHPPTLHMHFAFHHCTTNQPHSHITHTPLPCKIHPIFLHHYTTLQPHAFILSFSAHSLPYSLFIPHAFIITHPSCHSHAFTCITTPKPSRNQPCRALHYNSSFSLCISLSFQPHVSFNSATLPHAFIIIHPSCPSHAFPTKNSANTCTHHPKQVHAVSFLCIFSTLHMQFQLSNLATFTCIHS